LLSEVPTYGKVADRHVVTGDRGRFWPASQKAMPSAIGDNVSFMESSTITGPITVNLIPYVTDNCCREVMTIFYGVDQKQHILVNELYQPGFIEALRAHVERGEYTDNGIGIIRQRASEGAPDVFCPICDIIIERNQLLAQVSEWQSGQFDNDIEQLTVEWPSLNIVGSSWGMVGDR
jgi:hypothetical protein